MKLMIWNTNVTKMTRIHSTEDVGNDDQTTGTGGNIIYKNIYIYRNDAITKAYVLKATMLCDDHV